MNNMLLRKILDLVKQEVPSKLSAVFRCDNGRDLFLLEEQHNSLLLANNLKLEVIREALETGHPVVSTYQLSKILVHIVSFPLYAGSNPIGAVYLARENDYKEFTPKEIEVLAVFSQPLVFIIKKNSKGSDNLKVPEKGEAFLLGKSRAHRRVLRMIDRVKNNDVPVFITGESGTGKELVARTVHQTGRRKNGRFVALNCGAIPDHLLESELFGYAKGAFTGATRNKPGLIEEAHGGTFFLDEIGDLSLPLQAKLLRVLQEKEIRRIGENQTRYLGVRFISATNKDIEGEIAQGRFREDLYYRLKIVSIDLPPLRERKEDVLCLLNYMVSKYCDEMNRGRVYFSPGALECLLGYSWPGNVRELQNEIQRCLVLCGEENLIKEESLSRKMRGNKEESRDLSLDYFHAKAEFEKRFLNEALARSDYNRTRTAEEIGLSRQGLFKLMKKHGIDLSFETKAEKHTPIRSKNELF